MKTRIKTVLLLILSFLFLNACNTIKEETIKIGVIAPLTGDGARYGEAMKSGIDIAVEELNEDNGFHGKKIVVIYQDDKFSPKEALNGFNYLKDVAKVPVIFGPAGSGISKLLAPYANNSKIVLFSSISTSDTLSSAGEYFFRNISANSIAAKSVSNFLLNDLKLNTVGVFYENNEYGINMNKVFKSSFTNGNISFNLPYEFGQTDFRSSITSIKNKKIDVIFIQGTTKNIANITKQLRENKINCPIITGDGGYGDEIEQIAGTSANGLYCTLPAIEDTLTDNYTSFKNKYIQIHNQVPDVYSVLSYDAVMMVFQSIKNEEGEISGELIKNKLHESKYSGLGGEYIFNSNGDVDKPFFIFQYNNGKYKQIN
jgi:branched-chain amino acid transport system substrate-binding protein